VRKKEEKKSRRSKNSNESYNIEGKIKDEERDKD